MQKLSLKHIPVPDLYQRLYGFFSSALQIELPNLNLSDVTFLPVMKKKNKDRFNQLDSNKDYHKKIHISSKTKPILSLIFRGFEHMIRLSYASLKLTYCNATGS